MHTLNLRVEAVDGPAVDTAVPVRQLLIAGYTGRDRAAVMKHIEELEELGVAPPPRIPMVFVVDPELIHPTESLDASGPETSGEVEVVLINTREGRLIAVGSDHTDRAHEAIDIDESKGMCAKPISGAVWRYDDVDAHWDDLELRSWTSDASGRRLYQEGTLAAFLSVDALVAELTEAGFADLDDTAVFGGTVPAIGGLSCGTRFEVELRDPVFDRTLSCAYDVSVPSSTT